MRPKRRRRYKGYYRNVRINKCYFKKYEKLYKRALYEMILENPTVSRVVRAMTFKSITDTIETANMLVENPNIMKCR